MSYKKKVVLCATEDWANVGYSLAESLKEVGYEAKMLKLVAHPFSYNNEGSVVTLPEMIEEIRDASVVQFMHSLGGGVRVGNYAPQPLIKIFNDCGILRGKKVLIFHGGTQYRQNSDLINSAVNQIIDASIVQTYDLLGLGAKNENWVLAPVSVDIDPSFERAAADDILVFAHYPSNPTVKNSSFINSVFYDKILPMRPNVEYQYSSERLAHFQNLSQRVAACDVYIDHQGYFQEGKRYGEFGIATLEAAALGKIVITCSQSKERYEKEYGEFVPFISNNEEEFEKTIHDILDMSESQITALKKATYEWVQNHHSYEAIGTRLKRIYEK